MKTFIHRNILLFLVGIRDKFITGKTGNAIFRIKAVYLTLALLLHMSLAVNAQFALPVIPSNSSLANRFELSTEMVFRVKTGETFLPGGALIAYINGEIRGAQTTSVLFPPTGNNVFKILVFNNKATGDSIQFKYYDITNEKIYSIKEHIQFVPNQVPDYANPLIVNAFCGPMAKVSGMIPENGKENLNATVDLFWQPSLNANSYNLYFWADGTTMPVKPTHSAIYNTSFQLNNLKYGQLYRWKTESVNGCSSVESDVQTFRVRQLPDLTVSNLQAPASLQSGSNFTIGFKINNTGSGNTSGASWTDAVYVSKDQTLSSDDKLLSVSSNVKQLNADSSYLQTATVSLPLDYTGNYYFIISTDNNNNVFELLESNNVARSANATSVSLKPLPDILVKDIQAGISTINPGDSLTINWKVENIGGVPATGGWTERITLIPVSGSGITFDQISEYKTELATGGTVNRTTRIKLPDILKFSGQANIQVELFPATNLLEYPANTANNKAISSGRITVGNLLYLDIQSTSVVENSTSPVRCIITRSGGFSTDLVVSLTFSPAGQITIPASVTIPANQSSIVFNFNTVDNGLIDGTRDVKLTAVATSHSNSVNLITITDDEIPGLSSELSKSSITEGETITLTVTRNLITDLPLNVSLSTNKPSQWSFPTSLVIPANTASATVSVSTTDDNTPELTGEAIIFASSAGVNTGKVSASISDNDVPQVSLELLADTVSESAGVYATWGVLKRIKGDDNITVNLTSGMPDALFSPASITLPKGAQEQKFNIGVIDNGDVDGYRKVILSGSVYISSCNCGTSAENGGIVSDSLVIADNDGPSLSVTISPLSLPEGKLNAGTLTITRNTSTNGNLVVSISHNDPTEVGIQALATIPDGQKSVQVPVNTLSDTIEDGNQMVSIQASATTFSSGYGYVFVTDLNKPDLVFTNIAVSDSRPATSEVIEITGSAGNIGLSTAPSGVKINFYCSKDNTVDASDILLGDFTFPSTIIQSATANFNREVVVPTETGTFFILAKINPTESLTELVYFNNVSDAKLITIAPEYTATALTDSAIYLPNTTIPIHGLAINSKNAPVPNADVDVYILSNGTRRELKAKTNSLGEYSVDFAPISNESGHFTIGACFPKQNLSVEQDKFDIPGLLPVSSEKIIWETKLGQVLTGKIAFKNTSEALLNKLIITADKLPKGCQLVFDTISVLKGNQSIEFNYTLKANELTSGMNYEKINLQVRSMEGISFGFPAFYYCQSQKAQLKAEPVSINTTMTKSKQRLYELAIYNNGAGETGEIIVSLPKASFMTLVSPTTIPNLAPSDTATVILNLTPNDETPLNLPISGSIAINCENGTGIQVPFRIEAVSEEAGGLRVDVIDEYTYYTEAKPHVKNAHVVVRHPFSGKIMADGFTDEDGIFAVDSLPEGYYKMTVEAEKHESFQTTLTIDPGRINEQSVFISFQAITYTWEVVPTLIEDQYEVQLVMKYETNVPVPVVIVEMPKEMPQLFNDETYPFLVTLTNKGLITAKDVEITFPQDDPEYEFVTNFTRLDLFAQQSIQVPVVMQRKAGLKTANTTKSITSDGPCTDFIATYYGWECGKDRQWNKNQKEISFMGRVCGGGGVGGIIPIIDGGGGGDAYYPVRTSGGGSGGGGGEIVIPKESPSTGCDKCLIDAAQAVLGCAKLHPVAAILVNVFGCVYSALDLKIDKMEVVNCAISFAPSKYVKEAFKCGYGIYNGIVTCYGDPPFNLGASKAPTTSKMPPILRQSVHDLQAFLYGIDAIYAIISESMGSMDWQSKENFADFVAQIEPFTKSIRKIQPDSLAIITQNMAGTDITADEINAFALRWNTSLDAQSQNIFTPTVDYPNIIDNNILIKYSQRVDSVQDYTLSRGFTDVLDLYSQAAEAIDEQIYGGRSSVCASVSINITQKVVMTREAFEGTLTIFNGHSADAMKDIKLNLEIKDENGVLSNDLFQINTKALSILTGIDGTGSLGAQLKGSATVLFIPEKGAAPTLPKSYSFGGSFSYLDPFTGVTVTKPLFPVTLDVNPSPDLYLHYFMQRDILGDDPLTEPIEPIVPAEFAVMIQNNGFGAAQNVRIESAQPKIVENKKGLAINFALIGSNLNGQPRQLGLTNIDFGNIAPKKAAIGQWWFTSDLLGHFVNYEAKVSHLNSRGNPDISLISGATLHELIKSVVVYKGIGDGINDFLVNEVQDAKEFPDVIYLSNGGTQDVHPAITADITGSIIPGNHEIEIRITPKHIGWNYIRFSDPGDGKYKIVSVTREDEQVIPLDNVWQTNVTLPDGKEPVYENMMHFLDVFAGIGSQKYTVRFTAVDQNPPAVAEFENIPATSVTSPLTSINVVFNKPIDPATFNYEDMTLRVQAGADVMDNTVTVTQLDPVRFKIDLTSKSVQNGYFVLTVQASQISDLTGTKGQVGKQASWTQFINVPAISEFIGLPDNKVGAAFDFIMLRFNLPINQSTLLPERFTWKKNGTPVSGTFTVMDSEGLLFRLSGLRSFMSQDGNYSLSVDLPNIKALDGNNGILAQSTDWKIDQTAPQVKQIIPSIDGGYDAQHRTAFSILFDEPVKGFGLNSIELWKDGLRQPLSQLNFSLKSDSGYLFTQFRMLTYYEGNYQLKVKMKDITDLAGNSRTDTVNFTWIVQRTLPKAVTNLRISPDMGFSDTDNTTATRTLFVTMTVNEPNSRIQIYQTDKVNPILLADTSNLNAGLLTLPVNFTFGGNLTLQAYCTDMYTNQVSTEIPLFIDEAALVCTWKNMPQSLLTAQPALLQIEFSDKLLDDTKLKDYLKFDHDAKSLEVQNLTIQKSTDKSYTVSGFDQAGFANGTYSLSIDLSKLQKYSSGKQGVVKSKILWQILNPNKAPISNAGIYQSVNHGQTVTLDGSKSSDPDANPLTYVWTAPNGIFLSANNIANPTFTAPEVSTDSDYTFYLVVNDGSTDSPADTVVITVKAVITSVHNQMKEIDLKVYPSPFKDKLYFDLQLKQDADIRLEIYNVLGLKLQTLYFGQIRGDNLFRYEYIPALSSSQVLIYRLVVDGKLYTDKVMYSR
jgi:hypothetical protein